MSNTNNDRIVVLIDMDCFFCQVETRLQPEYEGKPLAVVQYNQWQLGGIIAVNYEARAYGVTRHMRGKEAKEKCPDLILASVPCLREKSDTSRYRSAGREVIDAISKHCNIIERASVDEAYLDITDIVDKRISTMAIEPKELASSLSNTFVVGYTDNGKNDEEDRKAGVENWICNMFEEFGDTHAKKLAVAGVIVEEIRADIYNRTKFRCSAGISQNKILAKLACGLHKPNRQTILPSAAVATLYSTLPVKKVRNLGGKFGDIIVESLGCNVMGDLLQYSLHCLQKRFDDKTGLWLYNIARGIDNEPVNTRLVSKSIGACKKFPGKQAIVTLDVLKHWMGDLAAEVCDRLSQDLEENQRRATLLTVSYHYYQDRNTISQSRSFSLKSYKSEVVAAQCVNIVTKSTQCPIAYLGISAGKFVSSKGGSIANFFKVDDIKDQTEMKAGKVVYDNSDVQKIASSNLYARGLLIDANMSRFNSIDKAKNVRKNVGTSHKQQADLENVALDTLEDSPVSRKLNKLIQIYNEHSKANSKTKLFNSVHVNNEISKKKNKVSYSEIETNDNDLKESFFLNVFRHEENSHSVKAIGETAPVLDSVEYQEKLPEKERDCAKQILVYNDDKEKLGVVSFDKVKNSTENHNVASDVCDVNPMHSKEIIDTKILQYIDDKMTTEVKEVSSLCEKDIYTNTHSTTEESDIDRNGASNVLGSSTVKLQEIFPDLNDIDLSIIPLLTPELQQEAYKYLKKSNNNENTGSEKESITSANCSRKNSKAKPSKPRSHTSKDSKGSRLYGFLIKGNTNSEINTSMKLCTQCGQMIPIEKYAEHEDFHIAQNLQEQINMARVSDESVKRKSSFSPTETSVKRRPNANMNKHKKNDQNIMAFLS